jgi:hypothetical protein
MSEPTQNPLESAPQDMDTTTPVSKNTSASFKKFRILMLHGMSDP